MRARILRLHHSISSVAGERYRPWKTCPSASSVASAMRTSSTSSALADRLALDVDDVRIALATLEAEGQVFQGRYRSPATDEIEWCNRRILARIHRATLGKLRREIEPVTAQQFHQFLA